MLLPLTVSYSVQVFLEQIFHHLQSFFPVFRRSLAFIMDAMRARNNDMCLREIPLLMECFILQESVTVMDFRWMRVESPSQMRYSRRIDSSFPPSLLTNSRTRMKLDVQQPRSAPTLLSS